MTNIRSTIRIGVAVALAAGVIGVAQPAPAQVTPQASAPIQLSRCDFETFNRYVYNTKIHYDLLATFTNRSSQPAKLIGIVTEFFDEQGNVISRLDAAYSGRFMPGQFIDHLRFGLGDVPNPSAGERCYVARVEFADGSAWSVADHYGEVERPPVHCDVPVKNGTSFEAAWNGPLCTEARELWDAAHGTARTAARAPSE
jgi:hypothetical protein